MSFLCQKESYLKESTTTVKSCKPATLTVTENGKKIKTEGFEIVLEDTILFPEGGGQPDDRGTINDVPVLRITRRGAEAIHFVEKEIPEGSEITMKVDWNRRFDHMQNHTAQHLITAITDLMFGFKTTSWYIGTTDVATIELDTASMSASQIEEIEKAVNEKIRECVSVTPVLYSDKDNPELKKFRARGLPDDHVGPVRVLHIDGIDSTLCCGTHVSNLSHIQAIRLLGTEKGKKNKINLSFLAGGRMLKYVGNSFNREKMITGILKGPTEKHCELADKVVKGTKVMQKTCNLQLREIATLEAALFKQKRERDCVFVKHRKDADNDYVSVLLSELSDVTTPKLITIGDDKEGGLFVLAGSEELIQELGKKVCELLDGKGAPGKGVFRGKASKLANRSKAEEMMRAFVKPEA